MKFRSKFDRYISITFFMAVITIILTSYFTFKEIITEHNKEQHSAIVPLFSLITSEILRPLNVANYMAQNQFLIDFADQKQIDEDYLIDYLKNSAKSYNMLAFVAFKKHGFMIDSSGKRLPLTSEQAEWFHRLKDLPGDQFTDIGNAEDPHLYFDNRISNKNGEFLGFTGVAIDLDYFAKKFKEYSQRFGFELYFVDSNNIITLSSDKMMKTTSHHRRDEITSLKDLPWYHSLVESKDIDSQHQPTVMHTTEDGLVISEMPIQDLNWRMYIVSPPTAEQAEYWRIFIARFVIFFFISLILFIAVSQVISYLKSRLIEDSETDHLTQLPNRSHVYRKFDQIRDSNQHLCAVLADVDNFKQINDQYGHLVGDDVLRIISEQLSESLRKVDVVGRWGGEEFIMLLPNTSAEQAKLIVERIRKNIEQYAFPVSTTSQSFSTTISFGICEYPLANSVIEDYISGADKALYSAKQNGRNQTVIFN